MPLLLLGGVGGGNWNGEFIGSGRTWADLSPGQSARNFWDAIREREQAINLSRGAGTGIDAVPSPGDLVITADTVPPFEPPALDKSYERIRSVTIGVPNYFVRKVLADGTSNYWPEGTNHIDSCGRQMTAPGVAVDLTFPAGGTGLSRRFELTIYATTNPTTTGTRAKFIAYLAGPGERFYGVRTTDAGFGGTPTTPGGEIQYDGRYFDVVAGAWVLSADQASPGQQIQETGVLRRYRGDFHDGKLADELRDGINQLTRTAGWQENSVGLGVSPVFPYTGVSQPSFNGGTADSAHSSSKGYTSTVSQADAAAHYAGAAALPTNNAFAFTAQDHWVFGDGLPHRWTLSAGQVHFVVPGDQYAANASMPNPLGRTRQIHFFVYSQLANDTIGEWDTQGVSDVQQDVWHEIGPAMSNSGTSITGPQFGDLTTPPSHWPTATPDGNRGWSQLMSYYILDWEAPGGFQFTVNTP